MSNKNPWVTVKMTPAQLTWFDKQKEQGGKKRTEIIRDLINKEMKKK